MKKIKYVFILASIILIANTSFAKSSSYSGQSLDKRVDRIEKDLRLLNKEIYSKGGKSSSSMTPSQNADFEVRLSSLEENIRKLRGEVETYNFNFEQLEKTIEKLQKDMEFRFDEAKQKPRMDLSAFQKAEEPEKKSSGLFSRKSKKQEEKKKFEKEQEAKWEKIKIKKIKKEKNILRKRNRIGKFVKLNFV